MTSHDSARETSLLEWLPKVFATALGCLYLVGFVVVASFLSRYGVSSFAVLHLQYLTAGIWAVGPPAILASLISIERRFSERAAPELERRFSWRRFAISSVASGISSNLFLVLLARIPNVSEGLTWGMGVRLFLFFMAMFNCALLFWLSRRTDAGKETWWINRSHAAPYYLALLLLILFGYSLWFGSRIYPLIPFSLGGGRPLTVVFFEGEKQMPDEIQKADHSAKRSIPYKLLLTTDKSFVVVSPSDKERSVEISRDCVGGIVVLASN